MWAGDVWKTGWDGETGWLGAVAEMGKGMPEEADEKLVGEQTITKTVYTLLPLNTTES